VSFTLNTVWEDEEFEIREVEASPEILSCYRGICSSEQTYGKINNKFE
jgi:hypothetical protein